MKTRTSETMKAIQIHAFGGPEVLEYEDVPRPTAGPGEVLIRVLAVGVNPHDCFTRRGYEGAPESLGLSRPRLPLIPGHDVSGIVETLGPGVTAFREGDAVYGLIRFPQAFDAAATYAEYTTAPAADLAHKPAAIDHIQAAAVPLAALTAWQALFEHANVTTGQTILVNGAAGGVGHFAVQLAKVRGARVIGVASGRNAAFVRELGIDHFIDYTTTPMKQMARN
jgi:NADPH:quinone reductase-like Zn-dependent oxidoreductase